MYTAVLQRSVTLTGVSRGRHISCVTSNLVWASDRDNLILTDTAGKTRCRLTDIYSGDGVHSVMGDGQLIYIDRDYNINVLSRDNKTKTTLISKSEPWRPHCVFCSPFSGDLLVGNGIYDTNKGRYTEAKVTKYSSSGQELQTIQHDKTGQKLYSEPLYITENRNRDVIVSDYLQGVVVTDSRGNHRFSYTGAPSKSRLWPRGICTDALSHILVCDPFNNAVQIIDKNGHFLSLLLTEGEGINRPRSLSYDEKTQTLWIGSRDTNILSVFKYSSLGYLSDPSNAELDKGKYIHNLKKFLKKGNTTISHARGILVGCAEAGKTTLLRRLRGLPQDDVEDTEPTRGLEAHQHVFTVRNEVLEAGEDKPKHALIKVTISDLKQDPSSEDDVPNSGINTSDPKNAKTDEMVFKKKEETKTCNVPIRKQKEKEREFQPSCSEASATEKDTFYLKVLYEKERLPTVSMFDFAGQLAYYACHQIYITPNAFFILVLDLTQRFEDVVSTEKNNQEGSIFSSWTYKDYVKFWIASIKTFGSTKAPVFVIATHTEGKSEEEIQKYFEEFWKLVPEEDEEWFSKSLDDREYAVGLLELNRKSQEILELIKKSLVKVVTHIINTKIEVPSSWALLEQLLKDGERKAMSRGEIWDINTSLPVEYQLKSEGEVSNFLKCFHHNGLLLYFEEERLREHVILDIQWFANAFNKLIADKNHINKDCKRKNFKEWMSFNRTGKLKEKLVDSLWKDEPSYLDHKTELMCYMEKLQMLVPFHSVGTFPAGMLWYVPCMNKKSFKPDICKENWEYSSILCFRFNSFAMFVFYRLIAYCMGCLKWSVSLDEDKESSQCLFQTAAIFDHKEHTVVVGICNDDIQLQVMRIKPLVIDTDISTEIGDIIETALKKLTKIIHEEKRFLKGYKCQNIICNEEDTSFTLSSELLKVRTGETQCKCCRFPGRHAINIQRTLGFWEKRLVLKAEGIKRRLSDKDSQTGKKLPKTAPAYPFSKGTLQRDILSSHIKVEVSRSVGLIHIDGQPAGTGFRVGHKYIMTCQHVVQRIITGAPHFIDCDRVYIQFEKKLHLQNVEQHNILHFEPTLNYLHESFDVAVLELKTDQDQVPPPLTSFSHMQFPSEVHLIGHPGGVQMKEDSEVYPCVIEPNNDAENYIKDLSEWSVNYFPDGVDYYQELRDPPRKILFHTTFDKGSSGSPGVVIKNHKYCVVLIVRGGTPACFYENKFPSLNVEDRKRVEYGYAMEDIFKEMFFSSNQRIKDLASDIFREWV
ncbi:uncharacterized protein LOC133190713 [Saccostrea echinata]|uniref:uncharacterized protein LOC133190713 n=1 Tax=Saccostrea echinata TaxID=191078 RepID=UPI002A8174AE|nr:uncharacterized protein LOC133190713 [Saccostrea echinata]